VPLAAFPKCYLKAMCVDRSMSVDTWIKQAATLDVDGLEFYAGFTPMDPAEIQRLRAYAGSLGLSVPMMCYSPDFTLPDATQRAAEIEKQKRIIATTAALGGKYCRVLSGQRRAGLSITEGLARVTACIEAVLPCAQEHGITLILENHYKDGFWEFPEFAQKMDVFLELLERIPESPWFGVNYDPSNAIIAGDDPIALLQAVKQRVRTMHASDRYFDGGTIDELRKFESHPMQGYAPILKHGVIGKGLNDYDKIFSILKSVGFSGWISIEDGEDASVGMEHLRLSAIFLREKMAAHGLV
jgi:sugar phosphate isomerase/epimerase